MIRGLIFLLALATTARMTQSDLKQIQQLHEYCQADLVKIKRLNHAIRLAADNNIDTTSLKMKRNSRLGALTSIASEFTINMSINARRQVIASLEAQAFN